MAARSLVLRTLYEALRVCGSEAMLARRLQVPRRELRTWLAAEDLPPTPVFLSAVDIVCDAPYSPNRQTDFVETEGYRGFERRATRRG